MQLKWISDHRGCMGQQGRDAAVRGRKNADAHFDPQCIMRTALVSWFMSVVKNSVWLSDIQLRHHKPSGAADSC